MVAQVAEEFIESGLCIVFALNDGPAPIARRISQVDSSVPPRLKGFERHIPVSL
jgi:hypothetical protein